MALDALKFMIEEEAAPKTRIRVFGVGGGGSNAVARMLNEGLTGVEFCVLNTDVQALSASPVPNQLAIGVEGDQRARRGFRSVGGPPGRAGGHRENHRSAGRRGHGVRDGGAGRRHGHGSRAGGRVARQGTGRADRRRGHQAVCVRRAEAPQAGRSRAWRNWRAWWIR